MGYARPRRPPTVRNNHVRYLKKSLTGLHSFFYEELRWNQAKVDETLLPIIQKMNKRNQVRTKPRGVSMFGCTIDLMFARSQL
jgi:hypothetical protein